MSVTKVGWTAPAPGIAVYQVAAADRRKRDKVIFTPANRSRL
jgi:hypothetical protein